MVAVLHLNKMNLNDDLTSSIRPHNLSMQVCINLPQSRKRLSDIAPNIVVGIAVLQGRDQAGDLDFGPAKFVQLPMIE